MEIVTKQNSNVKQLYVDGLTVSFDTSTRQAAISLFYSHKSIEAFCEKKFNPAELIHSLSDGSDHVQIKLHNSLSDSDLEFFFDSLSDYLTFCNFLEISSSDDVLFYFPLNEVSE
ncbi:hypothetical protein ACSEYT_07580 [Vibrio cidicii]|uniref:hypothetical protein n=1 Tax=Vibrio cidicii TaxID=1763883 RepID=UPI003F51425D